MQIDNQKDDMANFFSMYFLPINVFVPLFNSYVLSTKIIINLKRSMSIATTLLIYGSGA